MKVAIKTLSVQMDIKNNGVEFAISETKNKKDKHLGDLYVTRANLIWCEGKTTKDNGKKVSWEKFRAWMLEQ